MMSGAALLAAGLAGLGVAGEARPAQPPPACGSYAIMHEPGGPDGEPDSLELWQSGRRAYRLRAPAIDLGACGDLTGGGTPVLIVAAREGTGRCCTTFHVLELGRGVRSIMQWQASGSATLVPAPPGPGGEGRLAGTDDRLLDVAGFEATPTPVPVVFCHGRRGFEDCTRSLRGRDVVLDEWAPALERLRAERAGGGLATPVRLIGLAALLGQEDMAWRWISDLAPERLTTLKEYRDAIVSCLERPIVPGRDQRFEVCR